MPRRDRQAALAGVSAAARATLRSWARLDARVGVGAVVVIAGIFRLVRLEALSFRIDEGYTLLYSRQSWPAVLGFDGFYCPHPPLYFALVKLANVFVREEIAARSVAAVAGVATVGVFYAIVSRLLDNRAALAASLLLAVSPTHIEFSRDGRMYAPVVLMVAIAYLALIACWRRPTRGWALVYGAALALAVYFDYSAAYGLAPQAVQLAVIVRRHGRRARWLVAATAAAALAYVPWLPQLARTIRTLDGSGEDTGRPDYLAASWHKIGDAIPVLVGFDGRGSTGGVPNAWDRWSADRPVMLLVLATAVVVGLGAMRARPRAALVGGLLMAGTVLVSIGMSLVSPGFAPRTLVPSVLGLCLIAGACLRRPSTGGPLPNAARTAGVVAWGVLMLTSLATLPATLSEAGRYDWREITDQLAGQSHLDKPIVMHSSAGMLTDLVDLYGGDRLDGARWITITHGRREGWTGADRWLGRGPTIDQVDDGALADLLPRDDPDVDAFWYVWRLGGKTVTGAFAELGYEELMTTSYRGANLSLYARPGARLGVELDVGGDFLGDAVSEEGWRSSDDSATFVPNETGGRTLVLDGPQAEARLSRRVNVAPAGLYTLAGDLRVDGGAGAQLSVKCQSAQRRDLAVAVRFVDAAETVEVRRVQMAVMCPAETDSVLLAATRDGPGTVSFDDLTVHLSAPSFLRDDRQAAPEPPTPTPEVDEAVRRPGLAVRRGARRA